MMSFWLAKPDPASNDKTLRIRATTASENLTAALTGLLLVLVWVFVMDLFSPAGAIDAPIGSVSQVTQLTVDAGTAETPASSQQAKRSGSNPASVRDEDSRIRALISQALSGPDRWSPTTLDEPIVLSDDQRVRWQTRLGRAEQAVSLLNSAVDNDQAHLWAQALFAQGCAHAALQQWQPAETALEEGLLRLATVEDPGLYVRLSRALARVTVERAGRPTAIQFLRRLLLHDSLQSNSVARSYVRIDLASLLFQSGLILEATELYQLALQEAVGQGDERIVLAAGRNLIVGLMSQRLYGEAYEWLGRLRPLMERHANRPTVHLLQLSYFELERFMGHPDVAIEGLQRFILEHGQASPYTLGRAYEYLADALRAGGQLAASIEAAEKGIDLLSSDANLVLPARLSLVETLLAIGQFERAAQQLERTQPPASVSSRHSMKLSELRLRTTLTAAGMTEAVDQLDTYLNANIAASFSEAEKKADYYQAKLLAQQQETELARVRERTVLLAAENRASQARANELDIKEQSSRRTRNLVALFAILGMILIGWFVYINANRRAERQLRIKEQKLNEDLSVLIEQKSQELVGRVEEQAALARALEEKRNTEAIGQITGNVAHDFNNLLQVIGSANERLRMNRADSLSRRILDTSDESLQHASSIVRQLLAYSRRQDLAPETLNLSRFLQNTRELFRSAIGEQYSLVIEGRDTAVAATVDSAQLTTALLNLLNNAAQAMPNGGRIELSADRYELHRAGQDGWTDVPVGPYLRLIVTDEGRGMDPSELERACEPYFTTKGEKAGTGLGLSSVLGFVKQSGGDLQMVSVVGVGTTVTFLLPAVDQPLATANPSSHSRPSIRDKRFLLVEDNDMVANVLLMMLEVLGASVERVDSGDAAIARLQQRSDYDYLLSDIRMPGRTDGHAILRWVEQRKLTLQVLLMSGFDGGSESDTPVLRKPFSSAELLEFLEKRLAGKKPSLETVDPA